MRARLLGGIQGLPDNMTTSQTSALGISNMVAAAESALLEIWRALGKPSLVGWDSNGDACASWQGVACHNGSVTSLCAPLPPLAVQEVTTA